MPASHDLAVLIGRFQPFHHGHLALLRHALARAPRCVVVIGSAYRARSAGAPFTWDERAEMIRLALTEEERDRVEFMPQRDHAEASDWVAAVRAGVQARAERPGARVLLVGHRKDPTRDYLNDFPDWTFEDPGLQGDADAAAVRANLLLSGSADTGAALVADMVPAGTAAFLAAWARGTHFAALAQEASQLAAEKAAWARAPYPPVLVTVDAVVRVAGHVLLIRRGRSPGKGLRALPGGFLEQRETVYQSALRELQEETALQFTHQEAARLLRGVRVFDDPNRSARGRVITHAHYFDLGHRPLPPLQSGDDAAAAEWVPIEQLPMLEDQLLDDHFQVLDFFLRLTPAPAR